MSTREVIRTVACFLLLAALIFIGITTVGQADDASDEATAIQVIQVYAEGCFLGILAIGVGFAVYMGTRQD